MVDSSFLLLHCSSFLNPGPVCYLGAFAKIRKSHTLWARQLGLLPAEEVVQGALEMRRPNRITTGQNLSRRPSFTACPVEGTVKPPCAAAGEGARTHP